MPLRRASMLALAGVAIAVLAAFAPALLQQRPVAALAFAWIVVAVIGTAWCAASRLVRDADPSLFLLATALVAVSSAAMVATLAGAFGVFQLPIAVAMLAALSWWAGRGEPARGLAQVLSALRADRTFDPATAACALLLAAAWGIVVWNQVRYTPQDADSMWYHLVMPAEWVRTGSTWPSDAVPLMARAYPGFRQAIVALLALPMRTEHLALLGIVELPLLALAAYVLARSFGATRPLATAGATAAATTPVVFGALTTQGNDLTVAILVMLAAVFVPRCFARGERGDALLAGLALGALAATKFSGPAYAAMIVLLAALQHGVTALRSRGILAALALGPLVLAAPWYLRNVLAFGNPLYPARIMTWTRYLFSKTLFEGPLDASFFASHTLGWNVAPLWEHRGQFVDAHGWLIPVAACAFLVLAVRRRLAGVPLRGNLVALSLSPLLFVMFLHHPFNVPSFEASYSHRYLIAWASVAFATAAAVAGSMAALRTPVVLLAFASAALGFAHVTRLAYPCAALAAAAAVALAARQVRTFAANALARAAALRGLAFVLLPLLAVVAYAVESLRARWQYDAELGYRDGRSEQGWAGCVSFVHREIARKRVGLHGSHFLFPLLGEPWSNVVRVADEPLVPGEPKSAAEVAAWAIEQRLDFLVCCRRHVRQAAREFTFAPSIAPELLAAYPQRFTVVHESDGAMVLAVAR